MYRFELYKDTAGEWRWRFMYNAKIMADSSEGYKTRFGCKRALLKLAVKMMFAKVVER